MPMAYAGSQAKGLFRVTAAGLCHSHSNSRSLTHWARPEIEPTTSWFLVRFVSAAPQRELWENTLHCFILLKFVNVYFMTQNVINVILTGMVTLPMIDEVFQNCQLDTVECWLFFYFLHFDYNVSSRNCGIYATYCSPSFLYLWVWCRPLILENLRPFLLQIIVLPSFFFWYSNYAYLIPIKIIPWFFNIMIFFSLFFLSFSVWDFSIDLSSISMIFFLGWIQYTDELIWGNLHFYYSDLDFYLFFLILSQIYHFCLHYSVLTCCLLSIRALNILIIVWIPYLIIPCHIWVWFWHLFYLLNCFSYKKDYNFFLKTRHVFTHMYQVLGLLEWGFTLVWLELYCL